MINLTNVDGEVQFSCFISSYELPEDKNDDWCNVGVKITTDQNEISIVDPALTAFELVNLKSWFESLSTRKLLRFARQSFIEPNLEFEILAANDEFIRISVALEQEMRPDFELLQFAQKQSDWKLVFEGSQGQFSENSFWNRWGDTIVSRAQQILDREIVAFAPFRNFITQ